MKNSGLFLVNLLAASFAFVLNQSTHAAGCPHPEFAASRAFVSHQNLFGVAAGNFNSDSNLDVATVTYTSNLVSVALGNGNGTLQTNVDYLAFENADSLFVTDLNSDGKSDLVVYGALVSKTGVLLGIGDGTFQTNLNLTGLGGSALAIGDLNGDGTNDVVLGGGPQSVVRMGTGNLTFGTNYFFTTGESASSVAIGDLDADGIPDIVVGNSASGSAHLSVLLGNGNGTFRPPTNSLAQADNTGVAIGDFDKDGTNDVAVLDSVLGLISIFKSTGNGVLNIRDFKTTGNAGPVISSIRVEDFNNDGNLDVVVGDFQIFVFLGNGDGTIKPAVKYNQSAIKVDIGDFDNDGIPDLIAGSGGLEAFPNLLLLLGNGDGTFQEPPHYRTGDGPLAPAVADFNGDGKPDIAVPNAFTNTISVLLNNGDGTYGTNVNYTAGTNPQSIAVGDFSGDNKSDLLVANLNSTFISLFLGNGNGTFQTNVHVGAPLIGVGFAVTGDFNHDNKLDFAIPGIFGLEVYRGNGNGTFQAPLTSSSAFLLDRAVTADVNKDNNLDIIIAGFGTTNVYVLLGNATGTFQAAKTNTAGINLQGVAVADFNGDSNPDIAAADFGCNPCNTSYPNGKIQVMFGNGNGTFQPAIGYLVDASVGANSITAGDVNGDGKPDLIIGSNLSPVTWVMLNNGTGTFQHGVPFGTEGGIGLVSVGDVDADGHLDVLVANQSVDSVSVLLNTCPLGGTTGGLSLVLTPLLATNNVNTAHTVTATVTSNGTAKTGIVVNFSVTAGPNLGQSGTATTSVAGQGSFTYTGSATPGLDTIRAIAGNATSTATKVWITGGGCPTITVSPVTLPDGTMGVPYSQTITATGGQAPRTFAVTAGTLPTGLAISSAGTLSGTASTNGTSGFTVTAADANDCTGNRAYTLTVNDAPPELHDLAVVKLKAPKKINFSGTPVAGKFSVTIQNNSLHDEVFPDFTMLQNLVAVSVQSLSNCQNFAASMTLPKKAFPLTLASKKKLKLAFTATFNCVNDPLPTSKTAAHNDYRTIVTIDLGAIGEVDTTSANDVCPRPPSGSDPGCGNKTANGTLGAAVLTDVIMK